MWSGLLSEAGEIDDVRGLSCRVATQSKIPQALEWMALFDALDNTNDVDIEYSVSRKDYSESKGQSEEARDGND